jgi:transcriptional regulator with GAF, ATPase, and Fis domain
MCRALRERRENSPLLVEHFRVGINRRHGLVIETVPQDVLDALADALWRGNIRELEKALEQAMILRGNVLRRDDLRPVVSRRPGRSRVIPR